MSHLLKHREKDNKWRMWSTISDQWITDWLTEDEVRRALVTALEYHYKVEVIERIWSFPHGYYEKDISFKDGRPFNKSFNNWEGYKAFTKWDLEATRSDDYYAAVDKKFKELTKGAA